MFGTAVASWQNTGTTPTVTIAAFSDAVNSVCYFVNSSDRNVTPTPKAGLALALDYAGSHRINSAWRVGEELTPNEVYDNNCHAGAFGVEIKAPAASATVPDLGFPRGLARGLHRGLSFAMSNVGNLFVPQHRGLIVAPQER